MQPKALKYFIGFAATVLFLACHVSAQTTIFTDTFDAGPTPLWSNLRGEWVASNGVYFTERPSNNPVTYSGVPFELTDFTVTMNINGVADGGVWLHSDAAGENGILLVTGGNGYGGGARGGNAGTSLYWHQVVNGVYSAMMNEVDNVFTTPGVENVQIEVQVSGNIYSVYVNGSSNATTSLTNNTFSNGLVALYDYSSQTFDNVVIQVPTRAGGPFALAITNSSPLQATISWPTNANGFFLESTPSLPSAAWTPLTNTATIIGAQFTVPVAMTNTQQYFRLQSGQ